MQKEKKITKKHIKKRHKVAWKVWSIYRRKSESDKDGMVVCFSCGKIVPWRRPKDKKEKGDFANLGHFVHGKLDFDGIYNTQVQCTRCNGRLHGNLGMYAIELVKKHGIEKIVEFIKTAENHKGYTIEEIEDVIKRYGGKNA